MTQEMKKAEKTIVIEKSVKWWMTTVAALSLTIGLLGGIGIGSLTSQQQQGVQAMADFPVFEQQGQEGGFQLPPEQQGMPEDEMNGFPFQDEEMVSGEEQQRGNDKKKSAPSNADGSSKADKKDAKTENQEENTTNS